MLREYSELGESKKERGERDDISIEFFQSVHSIILKVNLSAGVWFRTTVRHGNIRMILDTRLDGKEYQLTSGSLVGG